MKNHKSEKITGWLLVLVLFVLIITILNTYLITNLTSNLSTNDVFYNLENFNMGKPLPDSIKQNGFVLGLDNAPVTVEMFSDYQCPICKIADDTINQQIINQYVMNGKVRFIYRPISILGDESDISSNAVYCANEQNRLWDYKGTLFANQKGENQGGFNEYRLIAIGHSIGLDIHKFASCIQSNKYSNLVDRDNQYGKQKGVNGTPTYFVDGKMIDNNNLLLSNIDSLIK